MAQTLASLRFTHEEAHLTPNEFTKLVGERLSRDQREVLATLCLENGLDPEELWPAGSAFYFELGLELRVTYSADSVGVEILG